MASPLRRAGRAAAAAAASAVAAVPLAGELRVARPQRRLTTRWERMPILHAAGTPFGISFRPLQARELNLDPRAALDELIKYPFTVLRLAAYWDRMEPAAGKFDPSWLDWQVEAAGNAGKQIIICVGPVKAFGYPEFFVPAHRLPAPLPEGRLITPGSHRPLLDAGIEFLTRIIDRYAAHSQVIAWQVEHESVDPLGMEHSWRLSAEFAAAEVAAARAADPSRPVLLNGFLPVSAPVAASQWWRTRDQGDSLAVASRLADIVGIDYYPRHALAAAGSLTLYLDGIAGQLGPRRYRGLAARGAAAGQQVMISEIQAEPWEAVTVPPSPPGRGMYSCLPGQLIANYNQCARWSRRYPPGASAYLFWGAEYWLLRARQGDPAYLRAFGRVLDEAGG
jgi:hypothetical protein